MSAKTAFIQSAERVLTPKNEIRLSSYVEDTVRLSPLWEAGRGKYSLEDHPYWRDILNAMIDPEVRMISIIKSTRVGGTLAGIAAFLGISELDPAPAMIVTPDEPSGTELRDRLYDTALESDQHAHRVPLRKFWNTRAIDLSNMRIYLAWAGSKQRLRGRTCQRVFRTEIDVYPDLSAGKESPLNASAQRVKRSPYSLIYSESSPVGEDSAINKLWLDGNQMKWFCPCPICNWFQELRFFTHKSGEFAGKGGIVGFRDDSGGLVVPEKALETCYYACERGCTIPNERKNEMVKDGVWVPKGQFVTASGDVAGFSDKSRRHISAHLWTIVIPTVTIGSIAEAYIKAMNGNVLGDFLQNELGVAPRLGRRIPEWQTIARRFQGKHSRGEVPPEAWFLTTGVDVQLHGVYWCTWAWGHMGRCWLIDWGYLRRYDDSEVETDDLAVGEIASDIRQLDHAVLNRSYKTMQNEHGECIPNPLGDTRMSSIWVNIDANYRKNSVLRYCFQRQSEILHAIRGDHHRNQATTSQARFGKVNVDKTDKGKATQEQELWNVGTNHYKFEILEILQSKPASPEFVRRSESSALLLPQGIGMSGRDFMIQFCNDNPVEEPRKQGSPRLVWKMQNPSIGRDYFHASAYARCGADMFLTTFGLDWDSNKWQTRPIEQPQQIAVR